MGNKNTKGSSSTSSTTISKEENVVAPPQPHQEEQPQSPKVIEKPQPQQPLQSPYFEMPLLYPSYKREDYEKMNEEEIDSLLASYGIMTVPGDLAYKRKFAIETFCWDQNNDNDQPKA